jgi:hypothetical protein
MFQFLVLLVFFFGLVDCLEVHSVSETENFHPQVMGWETPTLFGPLQI